MEETQEDYIADEAKKLAKIVKFGASKYDQLKTLEERLRNELEPYSNKNKILFINIWKEELENLFKDHLSKCPDPENCPQHKTYNNAAFLFNQFKTSPDLQRNDNSQNRLIDTFKDKNDLNYYFNADNIPNQDLVFQTYNFFKKGGGKTIFEPLDFLNLLNWHYRFLTNNVAIPFSVLDQFTHLPLSKKEQHILIGFTLKWFGGYPVHNLNSQFNTTLKLLEEEYLEIIANNNKKMQEKINMQLCGNNLSKNEEKELELLKTYQEFLITLDKVVANTDGATKLNQIENKINQSLTPVNTKEEKVKKVFVFVSHSSKDEQLVKLFTDKILQLILKLDLDNIFCTSIEGCSITSGDDFRKFIKSRLMNATHVIQIITENYKKSEVCLNEMGAAWVLENKIYPFIIDPITYENIGFIHNPNQLLKLNRKEDLLKFTYEMTKNLESVCPHTEINRHTDDFLLQLNHVISNEF